MRLYPASLKLLWLRTVTLDQMVTCHSTKVTLLLLLVEMVIGGQDNWQDAREHFLVRMSTLSHQHNLSLLSPGSHHFSNLYLLLTSRHPLMLQSIVTIHRQQES